MPNVRLIKHEINLLHERKRAALTISIGQVSCSDETGRLQVREL